MVNILLGFLGLILFFIPGILIELILFKKNSILKRIVFSIAIASSISVFIGLLLALLKILFFKNIFIAYLSASIILLIILKIQKTKIKTDYSPELKYLLLFSLIGSIWRLFLIAKNNNFGDAYSYASYLIHKGIVSSGSLFIEIPNLNFYTGMVGGHYSFLGSTLSGIVLETLSFSNNYISIFLGTLMFIGFAYLAIFSLTKRYDLSIGGALILSLGPVELWHSTIGFIGHPLSYIAVFSLFILFSENKFQYFILSLIICSALILSQYTGAMAIIILSIGFIISSVIESRKLINKKIIFYLIINLAFVYWF